MAARNLLATGNCGMEQVDWEAVGKARTCEEPWDLPGLRYRLEQAGPPAGVKIII